MKKYIIMALLPLIFQGSIYCVDPKADLNKAIQPQLISARNVMQSKTVLELDPILDTLVSYAKRGNDQSVQAINKMKDIESALQKYRSDQYTFWINTKIFFGSDHPKLVTDQIDPAIKRVAESLKIIQSNASSAGYIVAASLAGAALVAILAWVAIQPGKKSDNTSPQYEYTDLDAARLDKLAKDIATQVVNTMGFNDDTNRTYYKIAYSEALQKLKGVDEGIIFYASGSAEYDKLCNAIKADLLIVHQRNLQAVSGGGGI